MPSLPRVLSPRDLPDIPGNGPLEFTWYVGTDEARQNYYSQVSLEDGAVIFKEHCYSCDGKYSSAGDNHFQEVVKWMKKKYGKRFVSVTRTYQDYDCGCYFED